MKSTLRTLALSVIVSLTLACATITNPQSLLRGSATPTPRAAIAVATPGIDESGAPELATQLAGTLEPETGPTPEGGEGSVSAMGTEIAATLEAALGGTPQVLPKVTANAPSQSSADAAIRVANSLSVLLDQQPGAETLPSYHLEVKQLSPVMNNGAVAQAEEQITADVQGADVHFTDTTTKPGGKPVVSEAYIIGDKNYTIKDGKVTPDFGLSSVAWSTWPINAFLVLGLGSLKTVAAGTETLEGRPADVYTLTGTSADDPTGALSAVGVPVTDVKGQLWVDQATGALLKATLDYKAIAADSSGTSNTSGPGRLEVTVTQIGQTTVKDPSK